MVAAMAKNPIVFACANPDPEITYDLAHEARKDVIDYFAEHKIVPTSMMDISDGLSSEMLHICKQSNVGCNLFANRHVWGNCPTSNLYPTDQGAA